MAKSSRLDFPSTRRNVEPIIEVLKTYLPIKGTVLELAAGSGQHVMRFSRVFPDLLWQPTDIEPAHLRSISAWTYGLKNVLEPIVLDASNVKWPIESSDAIICINMLHIAPWAATVGLFTGASRILEPGGMLYLYGPYKIEGKHISESNARFDADLRTRNDSWGLRDLTDIMTVASKVGLKFGKRVKMPSNNLSVIFKKPVYTPPD